MAAAGTGTAAADFTMKKFPPYPGPRNPNLPDAQIEELISKTKVGGTDAAPTYF